MVTTNFTDIVSSLFNEQQPISDIDKDNSLELILRRLEYSDFSENQGFWWSMEAIADDVVLNKPFSNTGKRFRSLLKKHGPEPDPRLYFGRYFHSLFRTDAPIGDLSEDFNFYDMVVGVIMLYDKDDTDNKFDLLRANLFQIFVYYNTKQIKGLSRYKMSNNLINNSMRSEAMKICSFATYHTPEYTASLSERVFAQFTRRLIEVLPHHFTDKCKDNEGMYKMFDRVKIKLRDIANNGKTKLDEPITPIKRYALWCKTNARRLDSIQDIPHPQ